MTVEAALHTELEICDPHHHLWDRPQSVYMPDDLGADIRSGGHRVTSTVFVECRSAYRESGPDHLRPVGETEWVRALASDKDSDKASDKASDQHSDKASDQRGDQSSEAGDGVRMAAGIVGFADLTLGEAVVEVLHEHVESGRGRFRGIRHASGFDADERIRNSHTNPPAGLYGQPAFRDGLAALGDTGLTFEAWLYHPQLPELVDLARAHPDVTIVLDHIGGPLGIGPYAGRRDEVLATWRTSMQEVARCDNVVVKLGGIGMPIFGMDWHHRDVQPSSEEVAAVWGPEIRWCIETFGVDRAMFESNFPVDARSFSYSVGWNAFLRMTDDLSGPERRALFRDTARRIYQI